MPDPTDTCLGVILIHRHGARGLVRSSAASLCAHGSRASGNAAAGWAEAELEEMTTVGTEQMRQLGRWLALRYLPGVGGGTGGAARLLREPPKWRSSLTPRVVQSGSALLEALSEALPGTCVPSTPAPYRSDAETDNVFRSWHSDESYLAAIRALRGSEGMASAALKGRKELDALYAILLGAASPEEVGVPLDGNDDAALGRRLFQITYLVELLSCEMHWPATAAALRNGLVTRACNEEGAGAFASGSSSSAPPASEMPPPPSPGCVKATLLRRLSPAREAWLRGAARWVWEQRFLTSTLTRPFGGVLGGAIVAEALADLTAAALAAGSSGGGGGGGGGTPTLAIYSAHDYTLLAILAALRCARHPEECIGFGAFITMELWRPAGALGTSGAYVNIKMCADPFASAAEGNPTSLSTAGMHTVCDGVALGALNDMARKWPAWEGAAKGSEAVGAEFF